MFLNKNSLKFIFNYGYIFYKKIINDKKFTNQLFQLIDNI